ncbi:response regulator transcription factor [Streptantibioticus silvisoli]|uniref:Response regulator transcription factor n=1 Tax=Streptantibioticus silvisoli TaxID=2705255 RepID=A0ABT6W6K5_9ACTN|nr:response regulator transcription factor [Streptantibioticus silvisoli]MDI5966382.1 response regulator transcription factor [Streptantibioticus silvisoli]
MAGRAVRVVVADDQTVVREGIAMLLGLLPGLDVVGAAADGEEAVRLVADKAPDVVLMDLRMPRCNGVEATRIIRRDHPGTQVVILTTFADDDSLFAALRAGARGYLTKDAGSEEILRAVEDVMRGEAGLSPKVQRRLLERLAESAVGDPEGERRSAAPRTRDRAGGRWPALGGAGTSDGASGGRLGNVAGGASVDAGEAEAPDGLTTREAEVLALVAEGMSNGEIAAELYVSPATVKTHINNLFAKIGVRDRVQAARYAYRRGIGKERNGS